MRKRREEEEDPPPKKAYAKSRETEEKYQLRTYSTYRLYTRVMKSVPLFDVGLIRGLRFPTTQKLYTKTAHSVGERDVIAPGAFLERDFPGRLCA